MLSRHSRLFKVHAGARPNWQVMSGKAKGDRPGETADQLCDILLARPSNL